jgi:outer membrane protein TolC
MKKRKKFFLVILLAVNYYSMAQDLKKTGLKDAILIAQKKSLDYKIAFNIAQSAYWSNINYNATYLPKLSLSSTLPDYYRTINTVTLGDGQNYFVAQNVANSSLNLNLSQNIIMTGGSISVGSSLMRIDNFGNYRNTNYTSIPFSINYYQPNLFYNDFKWQKKIAPLKVKESQRQYIENLEEISINTVSYFFARLIADVQLKLDKQNFKNIDTLVKVTKARYEIGTTQLNDVLQSEVSLLKAQKALFNSNLNLQGAEQNMLRYLNIDKAEKFELMIPDSLIFYDIAPELALQKAQQNRKYVIEYQRRRLEAKQNENRVNAETGPRINIRANIGFTQTGATLDKSYNNLLRNEGVTIGLYIPLLDWGVNRSNRKRAEANTDLENNTMAQQELLVEQEIYFQINKWNTQKEQMKIATETNKLSQRRYEIATQKYSLGTMSFTDYNNSQLDKDKAAMDYMYSLQSYWTLYYIIRRLTLYDFENKKDISFPKLNFE